MKPQELIVKTSEELKNFDEIKAPEWSNYAKTGSGKARPPVQKDWWYLRAASVLSKASKLGPIGVNKLKVNYGSKKRRGHKPAHFYRASGNIIRKILQQLEKAGLLSKASKGVYKGRIITPKGISLLSKISQNGHRRNQKEEIRTAETTSSAKSR